MQVSAIVPVLNKVRTIDLILEKLRRSPVEKEIIIVDGKSEDGAAEKLNEQENILIPPIPPRLPCFDAEIARTIG